MIQHSEINGGSEPLHGARYKTRKNAYAKK